MTSNAVSCILSSDGGEVGCPRVSQGVPKDLNMDPRTIEQFRLVSQSY